MDDIVDRSMAARLQRHLKSAVEEFLLRETGNEPFASLETRGMDFHDYRESFRYLDLSLGVEIHVQVVD